MEARFVNNPANKLAMGLLYLLPTKCVSLSHDIVVPSELKAAVQFFSSDLPNAVMLSTEYSDWVRKWKSASTTDILPERLIDLSNVVPYNVQICM